MKNSIKILLALVLSLGAFASVHANKWEAREDDNTFNVYLDNSDIFQGATLNGNAATASALAADPANCSVGSVAGGITAAGVGEACLDPITETELSSLANLNTQLGSSIADGAHTAAAHGDGANCSAGLAPLGVDAAGAVQSCFDVFTESEATSHSGSANAHYTHATTLGELNTDLTSSIADGAHTTTLAHSAITSVNSDDHHAVVTALAHSAITGVGVSDHHVKTVATTSASDLSSGTLADARLAWFWGRDTTANICAATPTAKGDVAISSDNGDIYTAFGILVGDWRNGRTGIICP